MKTEKWPTWCGGVYFQLEKAWCHDDIDDIAAVFTTVLAELANRVDMPIEELPEIIKRVAKREIDRGARIRRAKEKRLAEGREEYLQRMAEQSHQAYLQSRRAWRAKKRENEERPQPMSIAELAAATSM